MATVSVRSVRKAFGSVEVLHGVDVEVEDGEFVILVGPSGCGKSTLLRMIAGLENITRGEIAIGGRVVNNVAPKERDIAMVFQNYALYPHMTVRDNMAFSLTLLNAPKQVIDEKVERAAKILNLTPYLQRTPRALSGGQRQRVAIGRAIVRAPKVFLFDEPLSNLDAALRGQTRVEIHQLHRDLGATTIYVTHDQVEAMTLADRIVVLRDGQIEQVGTPLELYDRPANQFVAQFIGSPQMNVVEGRHLPTVPNVPQGGFVGLRPEDVTLQPATLAADGGLPGTVKLIESLGAETLIYVTVDSGAQLVSRQAHRSPLKHGERVGVFVDAANAHRFDAQGRAARSA